MLEVSFDNNSTGHCLQPTSQALGAKEEEEALLAFTMARLLFSMEMQVEGG